MCGHNIKTQQGAAAISLAIIIVFCFMTLSGALSLLTVSGYKSYHMSAARTQAIYVAEAGLSAALREMKDNQDYDSNGTVGGLSTATLYDGAGLRIGDYTVTRSGGDPYTLTASGIRYQINKTITAAVSGIALFAGGDIYFKKKTININGHIYANNKIFYRNTSLVSINGNANANNTITGTPSSITGYSNTGVADIAPLPVLDFDYWKSEAQASGTYYGGDYAFGDESLSGIVYVDGDATINKNSALSITNGCLVATNNIWGKDGGSIIVTHASSASAAYPGLASQNGKITLDGGATITGLIYANGNIVLSPIKENSDITIGGALISTNDIEIDDKKNNIVSITHQLGAYQAFFPSAIRGLSFVGGSWREE
jgi:hypothetical protein